MSIQPTTTVTRAHAERWAERARLDLEASADRGEAGLNKIRTAISERHDIAIGARSISDYVSTQYADALGNVCRVFGVEFRRQVVAELSTAGKMSTRAIAAVTGTSHMTAHNDRQAGVKGFTPASTVNAETGEVSDDYLPEDEDGEEVTPSDEAAPTAGDSESETPGEEVEPSLAPAPSRPAVTGIDGKTYTQRKPSKPRRKALTDSFWTAAYDMGKRIESVHRLTKDDRFPQNAEKVAAAHRNDLIRYRDLLEQVISQLPEA